MNVTATWQGYKISWDKDNTDFYRLSRLEFVIQN